MAENNNKKLKARMIQKHDIEANWKKSTLIPKAGEIIIYDDLPEKIKVGDGKNLVYNLPFIASSESIAIQNEPPDDKKITLWVDEDETPEELDLTDFGYTVASELPPDDKKTLLWIKEEPLAGGVSRATQNPKATLRYRNSAGQWSQLSGGEFIPDTKFITRIEVENLLNPEGISYSSLMKSVTIFPNGRNEDFYLYTFDNYGEIYKFNSVDNSVSSLEVSLPSTVDSVGYCPDNKLIYAFTSDGAYTFDPNTENIECVSDYLSEEFYDGHLGYYNNAFYGPDDYNDWFCKYDILTGEITRLVYIHDIADQGKDEEPTDVRIIGHYAYMIINDEEDDDHEAEVEAICIDLDNPIGAIQVAYLNDTEGDDLKQYSNFFYNNTIYIPSNQYTPGDIEYHTYKLGTYYIGHSCIAFDDKGTDTSLICSSSEFSYKYNCIFAIIEGTEYFLKIYFDEEPSSTSKYRNSTSINYNGVKNPFIPEKGKTTTIGLDSSSYGHATTSLGRNSSAEGWNTIADGDNSHVQGTFNKRDRENKYAHIVGNGKNQFSRSNAYTLDWKGNGTYSGSVEGKSFILPSSTPNSIKKFKITIDDDGKLNIEEISKEGQE